MEGSEGVPLRFPRPAMVGVAIGLASASILLGSTPAFADSVRLHEWWLGKLGVTSAWQTSRGSGVTVAVLSDGVVPANPDLAGSVTTGPDFTRSGRTASGPNFGLVGTAIASLIAGHGHGTGASDGIIGVAPAAKILSVRVALSPGDPLLTSTAVTARLPGAIAAGIRYAVRNGASVIDLPIDPGQPGVGGTGGATAAAGGSAAERAAVRYARRKGVLLVAPAGDNGAGSDAVNYPAAYPGVISAGAFGRSLAKAAYSSHQSYVTLTAPGDGVVAATAPGSYATMSSTSAASAIVAGIAALIRSKFPVLAPALVRRALTHSTLFRRPGGIQDGSGFGAANAARALARAKVIAAPLTRRAAATRTASQQAPTPPPVPSATSSLVSKVLKAVVISAGVLILLLLPITIYAAVGRRRARRAAEARWERDQAARTSYTESSQAGTTAAPGHPDPMLEYFSPIARPPASSPRAAPGRRAEAVSAEDVPFLPSPSRHAGPRRPAASQGPGPAGHFDDSRDASSFPAASDPFRAAGDPFRAAGAAGDPSRPARGSLPAEFGPEPPLRAEGPLSAGGDPFEPARDPFGPARDPFMAANDPAIGTAGARPGPTGRRAGSHSRTGSPAGARPAAREPRTSGAPPWEPAAKPASDLPWAEGPAPQRAYPAPVQPTHPARAAHRRMPRSVGPAASAGPAAAADRAWLDAQPAGSAAQPSAAAGSIWDAAGRPMRRRGAHGGHGPDNGGQGPAASAGSAASTGSAASVDPASSGGGSGGSGDPASSGTGTSGSEPGGSEDPGTGPIYVWNPGASTETFPSVPANRDPSVPADEE